MASPCTATETTSQPGWLVTTLGASRGTSQGSRVSRPTSQNLLAISCRWWAESPRQNPGVFSVSSTYWSTKLQLTSANLGVLWRCTTSTRSAPWSHDSAAHSYALCRPPMITTRAPASCPKEVTLLVCARRAAGTSAYQLCCLNETATT